MALSSKDYVSLHTHSHTSLLDGFGTVKEYVQRTVELGQTGLGLTNHGSEHELLALIRECQKAGITPVPGCEFYVAPENPEGARVMRPVYYGKTDKDGPLEKSHDVAGSGAYLHQTIWAYNAQGLSNLMKLSELSYRPEHVYRKPRIDFDMLAEHSEGLIVATGCPSSEISTRLRLGQKDEAYAYAGRLKEVFGDRLFVEVMDHGMRTNLERDLLTQQLALSKYMGIPLLATNDSHYSRPEDAVHHEEMLASQSGSRMSQTPDYLGGTRFAFDGDQYYLKSAQEMERLFPVDSFPGAVTNSLLITEMCQDIDVPFNSHLAPHAITEHGMSPEEYLKYKIDQGMAEWSVGKTSEQLEWAENQLRKEWNVIVPSGFASYMLTVAENINWTNEQFSVRDVDGTPVVRATGAGRGSIGGSFIAYLLKISAIDPSKYPVNFERFLSDGRGNIHTITFEDGETTERIASTEYKVLADDGTIVTKYAHQLEPGDKVVIEEENDCKHEH